MAELIEHLDPPLTADDAGDGLGPVPHVGRLLEAFVLGKSMHVCFERQEDQIGVTGEGLSHRLYDAVVLGLTAGPAAGAHRHAELRRRAGSVGGFEPSTADAGAASTQRKSRMQCLDHDLRLGSRWEGAQMDGIARILPNNRESRKCLVGQADPARCDRLLVLAIEARLESMDQPQFEEFGLECVVADPVTDAVRLAQQLRNLPRPVGREVATNPSRGGRWPFRRRAPDRHDRGRGTRPAVGVCRSSTTACAIEGDRRWSARRPGRRDR